MVKQVILSALSWVVSTSLVIMALLHFGGDFPDIHSYVQPRLGAALLVFLIVSFGLFTVMNRKYLKALLPWAVILPLLWMGTFTWAYGFASLPEKKHLGDYYVLGGLLMALPYVYTALTARRKRFSSLWTVIAGVYTFFMVIIPFIYIGYYVLFGGEMDMFAMMAVRSTHLKEIKDFLRTMGSPARRKRFSSLWTVIAGVYTFFMVIIPFIYIGYYVLFGGEMDMFAMMAVRSTHLKEIKDFLRTMGSPAHAVMAAAALAIVIACAVTLSRSLMRKARTFEGNIFRGSGKAFPIGLAVISLLFFGGFYRQITHVFPASIIKALNSSGSEFQLLQKLNDNLDKNVKTMTFIPPNPGSGIDEGTHIVIIGESANRDHMKAFTPDYPENTTPWLSEMAKSKDFALGYKAYSNFPNTLFSLSYAMTSANQYSDMSFEDVVSMVDVAKAAGYRTDWISFHNRSSMSSAGVTMIAERCDDSYWEKNYDGYTLEVLKKLPPAKKRIIFINIDGSHYTYIARVPVNLRDKMGISKEDPYHDYDLTIAYDDQVMKDIFEYAKANLNLKSMIYFSDHGENMKHYHTTSPFYYDMVHIPFFVYLSPDYQAAHPELMPALKSHEQQVFTNDLAFDTVTGIWQAKTNFYQSKYDFSSKDYAINMDNATTFERKKKIKDDPVWQGK